MWWFFNTYLRQFKNQILLTSDEDKFGSIFTSLKLLIYPLKFDNVWLYWLDERSELMLRLARTNVTSGKIHGSFRETHGCSNRLKSMWSFSKILLQSSPMTPGCPQLNRFVLMTAMNSHIKRLWNWYDLVLR